MEAHLSPKQHVQVKKISSSCEICSRPHDTQYCMETPEQSFVEYASSRTDEARGKWFTFKPEQNNLSDTYNLSWKSRSNLRKYDDSREEELEEDENTMIKGLGVKYFDIFLTKRELAYHKKLNPREDPNKEVSNFTWRIKGMHIFVGNFTYVSDFMIVEDISSIIDPKISQVVLGKPFVKISNMTHDLSLGVVRFMNGTKEIAYKIEQYNSLLDLEKEHTKSVYFRNKEDKRRGVDYVMSKILGFYKECLELGPEYFTGLEDEGGVTKFFKKNEKEIFTVAGDGVRIYPDGVTSPAL
ncbi:hypothetical protein Tco_0321067 [Tanacetum coccineum]